MNWGAGKDGLLNQMEMPSMHTFCRGRYFSVAKVPHNMIQLDEEETLLFFNPWHFILSIWDQTFVSPVV